MIALDALAWILTLGGLTFVITGSSGLLRLPDLFTRLHAAGMTDTMGAGLLLAGMAAHVVRGIFDGDTELWMVLVRLVLVYLFLFFTSPIASHALARAALDAGVRPWRSGDDGMTSAGAAESDEPSQGGDDADQGEAR